MKTWLQVLTVGGILVLSTSLMAAQRDSGTHDHWVATWATSEQMAVSAFDKPVLPPNIKMPDFKHMKGVHGPPAIPTIVDNETVRMIVHTSIPGQRIRIELSNAFGKKDVTIGDAHVALGASGSSIVADTDRQLTFSGRKGVDIRPGQVIVSDPVDLNLKAMSDLAVSLYIVRTHGVPTNHTPGLHTTYVSTGDKTAAISMPSPQTDTSYVWLRSVDVLAPADSFAISCLGDSITDGFRTTVNANTAWPTLLAKRFSERRRGPRIAVLNAGISGNELLRNGAGVSALARFDRDVASEPGVRWVVLLEGINDINIHGQITGPGALTAADLIAGYKQLIARAHMDGLKIMGATLTPEEGVWLAGPIGEATREKVNHWIRTSGAFDAVIDFDAVMRDPANPKHIRHKFDSGDHIHPNDLGNAAMANAFDLKVFIH
jgi:lysophospholipase L1-like esterase